MKTVKIADATQAQLLRFATVHLQLQKVQPNTSSEKLGIMIKNVTGEDTIEVQESAEGTDQAETKVKEIPMKQRRTPRGKPAVISPLSFAVKDPRFLVTIAAGPGKDGKRPIFVAVNGTGMLVPRQQKVEIPARYFYNLENAIATVVEDGDLIPGKEGDTRTMTDTPAVTYTVHREPSQDELDEWHDLMEKLSEKRAA